MNYNVFSQLRHWEFHRISAPNFCQDGSCVSHYLWTLWGRVNDFQPQLNPVRFCETLHAEGTKKNPTDYDC